MGSRYPDALNKVRASIPAIRKAQSITDQARSVLTLVLEGKVINGSSPTDPLTCPNCDGVVGSVKSPYCGETCREIAGFVRQCRSGITDGSLEGPDKQIALGQILWRLLGGGLPLRNSLIEPKALARLMAKSEGRCAGCGELATTVDHIGSHCNRTSNLRPMCDICAQTKPFGDPELVARPETEALREEIAGRIVSPNPIRICDDAQDWDWRAYVAKRKEKRAVQKS